MNLSRIIIGLLAVVSASATANAGLIVVENVKSDMALKAADDLHITAAEGAIASGVTIDLADPDSRLYFDNIRPSDVISRYSGSITVGGEKFEPESNVRINVYRHGTEILPHGRDYAPLEGYGLVEFGGSPESYVPGPYYSNSPSADVEESNIRALKLDDSMRSFRLRRGYMATLATNPDGTGYSRCFIAENADLEVDQLPAELDGKVSFVRVFPWQQASKKGWVGGNNKVNPPEGYLDQQADATGSSWVYCWGTSADWCVSPQAKGQPWRNQEFVPEKWGRGGSKDWKIIANDLSSTHLLSYNEPDHGEQSNVSVEQALEEWPKHLESGLRLGSPATTDFSWLYRFMDGCRERNYRVDYVAIHAYWGGSGSSVQVTSVKDWYNKLKEIHEKTGCPIWITEWNNGANWTHESWPSDKAAQQEKQRAFMEEVLAMMDTCDFIERYSVYNWVEEKRSLFWGNLNLTPAGKVYSSFKAAPAFSRSTEVIPVWNVNTPAVAGATYQGKRLFGLRWSDINLEQTGGYQIERSIDGAEFAPVATVPAGVTEWIETEPVAAQSEVAYRLVSLDSAGKGICTSDAVSYGYAAQPSGNIISGRAIVGKGLKNYLLPEGFASESPVVVAGTQTYRMKSPMLAAAAAFDGDVGALGALSWKYNTSDSFVSRDTLSYIVFPSAGFYQLGGVDAVAGKTSASSAEVRRVTFDRTMAAVPVVIPTVVSSRSDYHSVAYVSGVSTDGFDVQLRCETAADAYIAEEDVDYVAFTPGSGLIGDREIVVGRMEKAPIGNVSTQGCRIEYGRNLGLASFFSAVQDSHGDGTYSLRSTSVSGDGATVFRNYETSAGAAPAPAQALLGWCAIGSAATGVANVDLAAYSGLIYNQASGLLYRADGQPLENVNVCSAVGKTVGQTAACQSFSTGDLVPGVYVATASATRPLKFLVN